MVAKAIYGYENFDFSRVNTIITLATPHQSPVIAIDENIANYYQKVDQLWSESSGNHLTNVTLVSIGGAERDVLVRSGLTTEIHSTINVLVTRTCSIIIAICLKSNSFSSNFDLDNKYSWSLDEC